MNRKKKSMTMARNSVRRRNEKKNRKKKLHTPSLCGKDKKRSTVKKERNKKEVAVTSKLKINFNVKKFILAWVSPASPLSRFSLTSNFKLTYCITRPLDWNTTVMILTFSQFHHQFMYTMWIVQRAYFRFLLIYYIGGQMMLNFPVFLLSLLKSLLLLCHYI